MLRRIVESAVFSPCLILELMVMAAGLGIVGMKSAAAVDCGFGLGFVPATLTASPATIEAGELTTLKVDLGRPVWFECNGGTNPVSKIYNQRVVGLVSVQLYSGDGQFTHLSYPSGFHIETSFVYLNEGSFEAGGLETAPIISGDAGMKVIGTAKILFDQKLTYPPDGQTETFKDRAVSILVFARPATVTVLPEPDM